MKKYRCPCCGDECLNFLLRNFKNSSTRDWNRSSAVSRCPSCHDIFVQYIRSKAVRIAAMAATAAFFLLSIYLMIFVDKLYILLFMGGTLLITIIDTVPFGFTAAVTQYDDSKKTVIIPVPDKGREIVLDSPCAKIRYLDIYGVRIKKKTNNVRFHETFKNDLIPVVFLNEKRSAKLPVHFMKAEYIPDELFCDNAEIEIVDNGRVIAKGQLSVKNS